MSVPKPDAMEFMAPPWLRSLFPKKRNNGDRRFRSAIRFTEKLLLEACLELMGKDYIVGIQDMGAAGLTSSSSEMAGRGGTGIELDLSRVPLRESGMTPYEILLSESQERMLLVAKKSTENEVKQIFEKWDLDAVVIGRVTGDQQFRAFLTVWRLRAYRYGR